MISYCSESFSCCLQTPESPALGPLVFFVLTVGSDPVPWPTSARTLGARKGLAGFSPGHTCSLYTLAEKFTPWSVLLCLLSDLLKKKTVSKLSFIRKCAQYHLPSNIIPLELSRQPLGNQLFVLEPLPSVSSPIAWGRGGPSPDCSSRLQTCTREGALGFLEMDRIATPTPTPA